MDILTAELQRRGHGPETLKSPPRLNKSSGSGFRLDLPPAEGPVLFLLLLELDEPVDDDLLEPLSLVVLLNELPGDQILVLFLEKQTLKEILQLLYSWAPAN